ncbi:hypothetical protein DFQ26_004721 [Actinomortierella ambigua]|nr:hypothetical protein DFQ26_004721 [Actinomortierella ambigua]
MLLGNSGSGKSTLLNLLGGQFGSGVTMRKGYTKNVEVREVQLGDKVVELIDVPGLFEPNDNETRKNAKQLTEALTTEREYILYFVLRPTSRGLETADLLMMAKVNQCVRRLADGEKVSYRVIINQIMDKGARDMCTNSLVRDNFRSLFKQMNAEGFSFDIRVESVHLLSFGIDSVQQQTFRDLVEDDIRKQRAARIHRSKHIHRLYYGNKVRCKNTGDEYCRANLGIITSINTDNTDNGSRVLFFGHEQGNSTLARDWPHQYKSTYHCYVSNTNSGTSVADGSSLQAHHYANNYSAIVIITVTTTITTATIYYH